MLNQIEMDVEKLSALVIGYAGTSVKGYLGADEHLYLCKTTNNVNLPFIYAGSTVKSP